MKTLRVREVKPLAQGETVASRPCHPGPPTLGPELFLSNSTIASGWLGTSNNSQLGIRGCDNRERSRDKRASSAQRDLREGRMGEDEYNSGTHSRGGRRQDFLFKVKLLMRSNSDADASENGRRPAPHHPMRLLRTPGRPHFAELGVPVTALTPPPPPPPCTPTLLHQMTGVVLFAAHVCRSPAGRC